MVFKKTTDGDIISIPHPDCHKTAARQKQSHLPSLLVTGGRLRGRTLATCEMLPLFSSREAQAQQPWIPLPNLNEHRGSHAAGSPAGTGLAVVLGGGTADGNSDAVEMIRMDAAATVGAERWCTMAGKLSSPRHAFEAVCVSERVCVGGTDASKSVDCKASIYAVGGWKYGAVSCASVERLGFQFSTNEGFMKSSEHWLLCDAGWESCAPLLIPRRLHSVAASGDGSSFYVFGGYVDERRTTPSIERYDLKQDRWLAVEKLPYGDHCPLVQAVADEVGFLIFPFSTGQTTAKEPPKVLRYIPGSDEAFSDVLCHGHDHAPQTLRLPIAHWHSFSATASASLKKAFLVGGTIRGKWTTKCFELNLRTYEWSELPGMTCARRRLAALILE